MVVIREPSHHPPGPVENPSPARPSREDTITQTRDSRMGPRSPQRRAPWRDPREPRSHCGSLAPRIPHSAVLLREGSGPRYSRSAFTRRNTHPVPHLWFHPHRALAHSPPLKTSLPPGSRSLLRGPRVWEGRTTWGLRLHWRCSLTADEDGQGVCPKQCLFPYPGLQSGSTQCPRGQRGLRGCSGVWGL